MAVNGVNHHQSTELIITENIVWKIEQLNQHVQIQI